MPRGERGRCFICVPMHITWQLPSSRGLRESCSHSACCPATKRLLPRCHQDRAACEEAWGADGLADAHTGSAAEP